MSAVVCSWWDCPTDEVAEWQQEKCTEDGWSCATCPYFCDDEGYDNGR